MTTFRVSNSPPAGLKEKLFALLDYCDNQYNMNQVKHLMLTENSPFYVGQSKACQKALDVIELAYLQKL